MHIARQLDDLARAGPVLCPPAPSSQAAMCSGSDPATAADESLNTLPSPAQCQLRVLTVPPVAASRPPTTGGQISEVRVDAKWQIGEVAQPRHHASHVVGGHAVHQERVNAHLFKMPRRTAERIALGAAPMLSVDPAHPVPAAPKAQPYRSPVPSSRSTVAYVEVRTRESVSIKMRSGGSSSNARASNRIVS